MSLPFLFALFLKMLFKKAMPEPLKNNYNKEFYNELSSIMSEVYPKFDKQKFIDDVFDKDWQQRELKERMHHTAHCLHMNLPTKYREALNILKKAAPLTPYPSKVNGYLYMFMPDFVELYGQEDWDISINALELFTQYSTSELAVRPFIIADQNKMMLQMQGWSNHENYHVRRLASEGCRPRLPWAISLPSLKKDPSSIIPILHNLIDDEEEYVRRSVANNLNDISKDHPELVLYLAKEWMGRSKNVDKALKHALRTLLKAGNKDALELFGFDDEIEVYAANFKLNRKKIKIGDDIEFQTLIKIPDQGRIAVRFEYGVYFTKSTMKLSKKIFKISEKQFSGPHEFKISKSHSFKNLTTRKHYPGKHAISLIINGKEVAKESFLVV